MFKRTEVRYHHTLSDNSHICMYFTCHKNVSFDDSYDYDVWTIGTIIAPTRRMCNDWYNKKKSKLDNKSTGKVGLEGLVWATNTIKRFINESNKDIVQMLVIEPSDNKRTRVYKRLCKTLGFTVGLYNNETVYIKSY